MTETRLDGNVRLQEARLPRLDWILLPLIGIMTILLVSAATKSVSSHYFSKSSNTLAACLIQNDPSTGVRGVPNSECRAKSPEFPTIDYKFNSCGHRAGMECGPKPPEVYRIVMIGSSYPFGLNVQREDSIAALLPLDLSRRTGRQIQIYNEAMYTGFPRSFDLRFNEIQAAQPDLILWIVTATDIKYSSTVLLPNNTIPQGVPLGFVAKATYRLRQALHSGSVLDAINSVENNALVAFRDSDIGVMLVHTLNLSPSQSIASYKAEGSDSFLLRDQLSEERQHDLDEFNTDAASIQERAKSASIPIVAVLVPERIRATMISLNQWPPGYAPYKLSDLLRSMIVNHGGTYVDILPGLKTIGNIDQLYEPVDNHPTPKGHAIISALIADQLVKGAVPALKGAHPTDTSLAEKR